MANYNPLYRFYIDWNGNDRYDHPESEVTSHVIRGTIQWGSNPTVDATRVKTSTAQGKITVSNDDFRFDANSRKLRVNEILLRRRNACKLEVDGTILWSGVCSPDQRATFGAQSTLTWDLESLFVEELNDRSNELTVNRYGTVAELAQAFSLKFGIPFIAASEQPTGFVFYTGSPLNFLDEFGRFAGGWCIETHAGAYIFQRYTDTVNLPLKANLDLSFGPLAEESVFTSRAGHVRNYAQCRSYGWFPEVTMDGTKPILGTATVEIPGGQTRSVRVKFRNTAGRRPVKWESFELDKGPGFAEILGFTVSPDNQEAFVTVDLMDFDVPIELTVTGYGSAEVRREASDRELTITDFDTVGTFGRKPLEVPVWFRPSYAGITSYTRPWLRNLSQPPEHIITAYRGIQATKGKSDILNSVVPGTAAAHSHVIDEREVSLEGYCLAKRIDWGLNERPLQTFFSVERRAEPPAPLTVRFDDITSFGAEGIVGVASPAGEEIYASFRGVTGRAIGWDS